MTNTLRDISNIRRKTTNHINDKTNSESTAKSINLNDCLFEEPVEENNINSIDFQYVRLNKDDITNPNVLFDKKISEKRFLERTLKNDDKLCLINTRRNREYNNVKIRYKPETDFTSKEYNIILKNSSEINQEISKRKKVKFLENAEVKPHNVGTLKPILIANNKTDAIKPKRKKTKETVIVKCGPMFENLQEELIPFEFQKRHEE